MHHPARHFLDDAFTRMEHGAHEAATSPTNHRKPPTEAQWLAVNWLHGYVDLPQGLRCKIENPRGTFRKWKKPDGTFGESRMAGHYGDIPGTVGADGDPVDIMIGAFPESPHLWVINQRKGPGEGPRGFDEHKVMAGCWTEEQARQMYLSSYQLGWDGLGSIVPCTYQQLKWWLRFGDCTKPFTADNLPFEGKIMDNVRWDKDANPVGMPMHQLLYGLHQSDAGAGLLLDAATMADLMGDPDIEGLITLDALVVQVSRMSIKMDMLKTVMAAAGDTVKPTEVTISDPVRSRGVLQVMVLFQMSDGQTISVWMHNPDTTPNKLTPMDELISWKWMLNKKDVTIVVAPERGQELNIREVARRVMRLVERNSEAFKRANAKAAERSAATEALKTEIGTLEVVLGGLQRQIEVARIAVEDKPVAWRGGVPAFQLRDGKMVITDWETGDPVTDYSGIAYSYSDGRFVLTEIENGERTINYLHAKTFKEAAPEADALREQLKSAAEEARQAKDKAAGKALVMGFIEDHGGVLSDWDAAGADIPGGWERAKLEIHSVTVNLGVSNGGVVQVNGDPFTPGDRKMNVTPEAVETSILAVAPVPDAIVAERKAAQELAEQTAQRRGAEDAVLTELGASPDDIFGMAGDGGYAVIAADEALSLKWQDVLDSLMEQRVVMVRNALRGIGWLGKGLILAKDIGGSIYGVEAKVIKAAGAGANVIAIEWQDASGGIKVEDELTRKAAEMAAVIDYAYVSGITATPAAVDEPASDPSPVPAETPEPEVVAVDPVASVGAAYQFADATQAFKEDVFASLDKPDYSPFVTAKTIDQRAKDLGLAVSWDLAMTVLDGVHAAETNGTNTQSLFDSVAALAKPYLTEGAVLDFAGDVSAAIAQLEIALDVVVTNEPINRARGDVEQADLEAKNGAQFRRAIDVLKAGDTSGIFDDASSPEQYEMIVGSIYRGKGLMLGRALIGGDGKAMIYVGASGNQRVTFVSKLDGERRPAMWSDDDAGEMVEWLVENTGTPAAAGAAPQGEPPVAVALTGNELGEFPDTPEGIKAMRAAAAAMLEPLLGEMVPCPALGGDVEIRRASINKYISLSGDPRKIKLAAKLKEIIGAGRLLGSRAPYDGDKDKAARMYHTLRTEVVLNEQPLAARLVVKEDTGGVFHYDLTVHSAEAIFDAVKEESRADPAFPVTTTNGRGTYPSDIARHQLGSSVDEGSAAVNLLDSAGGGLVFNLFIEGEGPEPVVEMDAEEIAPVAKGDISYRAVDDMFTSFYPDSKAGEAAWAVINAAPESEGGKVFTQHAASVIEQLRAAGYIVAEAQTPTQSDDELLAALAEPDKVEPVAYPIAPQMPDRQVWEGAVVRAIEDQGEMTTSDAQGLLMVNGTLLEALWTGRAEPGFAAESVLHASESGRAESPTGAPAADMSAADIAYLQTLINGTADMMDPGIIDRIEPMFAKYEANAEMTAMLTQAANAYSDATVAAAKATLAG